MFFSRQKKRDGEGESVMCEINDSHLPREQDGASYARKVPISAFLPLFICVGQRDTGGENVGVIACVSVASVFPCVCACLCACREAEVAWRRS